MLLHGSINIGLGNIRAVACRQVIVAHSSTELEYQAPPHTFAKSIQLQLLVLDIEIGFYSPRPPITWCDN